MPYASGWSLVCSFLRSTAPACEHWHWPPPVVLCCLLCWVGRRFWAEHLRCPSKGHHAVESRHTCFCFRKNYSYSSTSVVPEVGWVTIYGWSCPAGVCVTGLSICRVCVFCFLSSRRVCLGCFFLSYLACFFSVLLSVMLWCMIWFASCFFFCMITWTSLQSDVYQVQLT